MKSARRIAREVCLQGIYQWLLTQAEPSQIEANLRDNKHTERADLNYFKKIFHTTLELVGVLSQEMQTHLDRPLEELSPVERAILLMGACELKTQLDIPYRVVINEAVEVAKTFGGTDGFRYVNSILDRLALTYRSIEIQQKT